MTSFRLAIMAFGLLLAVNALDNGLGRTPPMGWNPWNKFACNINEELIKQTADALIETGLAAVGYNYLNIDDCWQSSRDPVTQEIVVDPVGFPSGMPALVKYVHSKGLKIGLYSDAGFKTCQGRPGGMGFEEIDAKTYSDWDIDYLKYDNCNHDGRSPKERYPPMAKALLAQKKKIFFSMCEWGVEKPHEWAGELANSWRTTGDISDNWKSFVEILDQQVGLEKYAGPGEWNDPDMLEVGNGGMTTVEYQAHFALWAVLKSPLLIGCDITNMSEDTKKILFNTEIIAVNQDSLGKQASRIFKKGDQEVWAVQVQDHGFGVVAVLFNRALTKAKMTINFQSLEINAHQVQVRDLVNRTDLGIVSGSFTAEVEAHGAVVVKFTIPKAVPQ